MREIMRKTTVLLTALALVLGGWSTACVAHDFWLEPDRARVEAGATINITLREGVAFKGNTLPYITNWFEDFSVVDDRGRAQVSSVLGNNPAATLTPEPGTSLIGYQSNRNFTELDGAKFEAYLAEEGLEPIFELRRERGESGQPAKEYFVRCAKAVVQSGVELT